MSRSLADVRLAAMMIDGLELQGRMMIVALGITTEGGRMPLGLWEGDTENATVVTSLLSDLVDRGLDPEQGMLFIINGSKALRKAIRKVFGDRAPVQRCVWHEMGTGGSLRVRSSETLRARAWGTPAAYRFGTPGTYRFGSSARYRRALLPAVVAPCRRRALAGALGPRGEGLARDCEGLVKRAGWVFVEGVEIRLSVVRGGW